METIPVSEDVSDLVQKLGDFYCEVEGGGEEDEKTEMDRRPFTRPFTKQAGIGLHITETDTYIANNSSWTVRRTKLFLQLFLSADELDRPLKNQTTQGKSLVFIVDTADRCMM